MKKIFILALISSLTISASSQCVPDPDVIAQGDPEEDGVLNPSVLEVYPGEDVDISITVLAPPDGIGEVLGATVPYTMNYFTVTNLENKPDWLVYECPNDCKYLVNVYSCVHVTGLVPTDVYVGDSVVMDVIVDANVNAVVLGFPVNGYDAVGQNAGDITIRYKTPITHIEETVAAQKSFYNWRNQEYVVKSSTDVRLTNIYNIMGNRVISSSAESIDLSTIHSGIYVVEILDGNDRFTSKLVKP